MIENVAVLIIRGSTDYLLQHRDNKPTISDPDTLSTWGGRKEEYDQSDEAAALRELEEETAIVATATDLKDLGQGEFVDGSPDNRGQIAMMHYFALEVPAGTTISRKEGQGVVALKRPYQANPGVNAVGEAAIARYEATT